MFKTGDRVRCINVRDIEHLEEGALYEVKDVNNSGGVAVTNGRGSLAYCRPGRFEQAAQRRRLTKADGSD